MLAKDYFQTNPDSVTCNACGRCCPIECAHLRSGNQCEIHPDQHKFRLNFAPCELKPLELVLFFGIYCPPAIKKLEERTGVRISSIGLNDRFCNSKELEKALSADFT